MLGVYEKADDKEQFVLTKAAQKFDETVNGKLTGQINMLVYWYLIRMFIHFNLYIALVQLRKINVASSIH